MNRFLIAFTAIVVTSQGARAEEIRFEKVAEYTTGLSPDQRRIDSYKMIGDSIFYTTYFFFAHQGFSGSSIRCLNRSSGEDRLLVTLYRTLPSGEITVHEISPGITGEIVRIGNVVHFPDVENYSYQCTLDGKYLGRFPDYNPDSDDENDIIVEGIKIVTGQRGNFILG